MAEETLDAAMKEHKLQAGPSRTVGLLLEGGKDWTPTLYIRLVQDYGLENEVSSQNSKTKKYNGVQKSRHPAFFFLHFLY